MVDSLIRGHTRFRKTYVDGERDFLQRLASEGQSPDALFVGCSDSRVVPEVLTSSTPGALFVVRNVANIVPPFEDADASVGAALEYAVHHLRVPHVVVCGHYGCGGVRAALDDDPAVAELPSLREWLAGARAGVERARAAGATGDDLWRSAVEWNVVEQLHRLLTYADISDALERGALDLHGWVYDLYSLDLRIYEPLSERFVPATDVMGN